MLSIAGVRAGSVDCQRSEPGAKAKHLARLTLLLSHHKSDGSPTRVLSILLSLSGVPAGYLKG